MASPFSTTYFEAEPGGMVSITILQLTPGRNYDAAWSVCKGSKSDACNTIFAKREWTNNRIL